MRIQEKLIPFKAHPFFGGGNLQTIFGRYLTGAEIFRPSKVHRVELPDGDALALCENRPTIRSSEQNIILLMHGLGGNAESPYMVRLAKLFRDRGWIVFRMNHRGCGQGAGWARKLYHSGRSEDISAALGQIAKLYSDRPIIAVGFSLSGNPLLKLLGEDRYPIPKTLRGAIAVAPPIDLAMSAYELSRPQKQLYNLRFVLLLKRGIYERQLKFPDFPVFRFPFNVSIWRFDDICTAPLSGFISAQDYYAKCSAKQFLRRIKHPIFVLASSDDPFIPRAMFDDLPSNPNIELHMTEGGGHMGYVSERHTPLGTLHWMDYAVLTGAESFLQTVTLLC
ncbi:alpha/beta fold hydrolase [bacterium]|nr:alpha/beta fold hydrolase [bacterium]